MLKMCVKHAIAAVNWDGSNINRYIPTEEVHKCDFADHFTCGLWRDSTTCSELAFVELTGVSKEYLESLYHTTVLD